MTGDCRHCKDWRGCLGKEWYSFAEIHWCAQQVFFLLKHADILRQGLWPIPDERAEVGLKSGGMSTEARFTKAILVIAELDKRLIRTGWRGQLLAEQVVNREKMMYLSDDAKDALYYVSGWRRKAMPFYEWRKKRRYRENVHQKVHKKEDALA
jgi:hypothetical protein